MDEFKLEWNRKKSSPDTYGWDNEFGDLKIDLKPFEVS